jgi:hypothetical protein
MAVVGKNFAVLETRRIRAERGYHLVYLGVHPSDVPATATKSPARRDPVALVLYQRSTQLATDSRGPIGSRVDDRRYAPTPSAARSLGPGTRLDDEERSGGQSFNPVIFEVAYVRGEPYRAAQHDMAASHRARRHYHSPIAKPEPSVEARISVSTGQTRKPPRSREFCFWHSRGLQSHRQWVCLLRQC